MCFNASKCEFLQITRKSNPLNHTYTVNGQSIAQSHKHEYLGVTINGNLDWKDHMQKITSSALSTLRVLRRNLASCPKEVKERAYQALVRPKLEYSAAVWNPYASGQVNTLESVQRQAARFVMNNFDRMASVTEMLQNLKWDTLATRRFFIQ